MGRNGICGGAENIDMDSFSIPVVQNEIWTRNLKKTKHFWICCGKEKFVSPTKTVHSLLPQSVGHEKLRKDCKLCVLLGTVGPRI
jgi:hypothetical protein